MKPSWKDAPEQAEWLAQNKNGLWWWYVVKPIIIGKEWEYSKSSYNWIKIQAPAYPGYPKPSQDWRETLEKRP